MSITTERFAALVLALVAASPAVANPPLGLGSPATAAELQGFIAVLPDGRGLPPGSGTVAQGKALYHTQCVACHGANLEGGLADKLIGGRGTLVNADPTKAPVKTIESYWPYATTLFDYVKRAMPLNSPGSLSNDQVYAVSAYILSEAKIVPSDAVMDAKTLAKVVMPNRDGFVPDPRPEVFVPASETPHQHRTLPPPPPPAN
jgi:cytochrome c